eukprot:GHVU01143807.1.p2 GENE.GHVU01143807.1~~GHVU01143807.1.p2  ORF type:complete len:137 (+),score=6.95 GHVU01143807.1:286-696(+)
MRTSRMPPSSVAERRLLDAHHPLVVEHRSVEPKVLPHTRATDDSMIRVPTAAAVSCASQSREGGNSSLIIEFEELASRCTWSILVWWSTVLSSSVGAQQRERQPHCLYTSIASLLSSSPPTICWACGWGSDDTSTI